MKWLRDHPSLALVLGVNLAWTLIAALAPRLGHELWRGGELSAIEKVEVAFLLACIPAWAWIAARLRTAGRRLPWMLAAAMVVQLVVILGEELDWLGLLAPYRNLRDLSRLVFPQVIDSPLAGIYLLLFLAAPLVPVERVRSVLRRADPVRASRDDAFALLAVPICWPVVYLLVGDQKLGELHQVGIYAVVGVITVRIVREVRRL